MRHLPLISFILLTCFGPAFSQDKDYLFFSMKEQHLSGPVKSATLVSFSAKPDGKGGYTKGASGHQYTWDRDMRITYNEAGGTVSAAELYPDGRVFSETQFTYTNGLLSEVRTAETVQVFEYDEQGRMLIMGERDAMPDDAGFYAFTKYEYDAAGHLVNEMDMDGAGEWEGGYVYTYDAKGNLATLKDDYEAWTETYTYDEKNRVTRTVIKDAEGTVETTSWAYDGKKTTETWEDYEAGAYSGKVVYTYENGLEVKTVEYDGQTITETQVTTYEFDRNGNWIRKVVAIDGKKFFIEERTIVYFQ